MPSDDDEGHQLVGVRNTTNETLTVTPAFGSQSSVDLEPGGAILFEVIERDSPFGLALRQGSWQSSESVDVAFGPDDGAFAIGLLTVREGEGEPVVSADVEEVFSDGQSFGPSSALYVVTNDTADGVLFGREGQGTTLTAQQGVLLDEGEKATFNIAVQYPEDPGIDYELAPPATDDGLPTARIASVISNETGQLEVKESPATIVLLPLED